MMRGTLPRSFLAFLWCPVQLEVVLTVFLSLEVVRVGGWEGEELDLVLLVMTETASNELHQLLNRHHCFLQVVLESEYCTHSEHIECRRYVLYSL